jgi:hypothetical protein
MCYRLKITDIYTQSYFGHVVLAQPGISARDLVPLKKNLGSTSGNFTGKSFPGTGTTLLTSQRLSFSKRVLNLLGTLDNE